MLNPFLANGARETWKKGLWQKKELILGIGLFLLISPFLIVVDFSLISLPQKAIKNPIASNSFNPFHFSSAKMPLNWIGLNFFILIAFLAGGIDGNNKDKGGGQANPDLSEMIGGFLEGMQAALGQMQKPDGSSGGGQQQDPMAGIKNLVDSIDPDQINKFIKGMASPDSLFDWIPAKFRGILPEEWRNKLGEVLISELDNLAKVWEAAANFKSGGDLWAELKGKTPTLAGLLEEIWEAALKKWTEFEGALEPEAKEYIEKVKSSFGNFISHQLLAPFGQLSGEAKWNLRDAFEKVFPLLEPMVTKAVQSEGLGKWAEELGGKSSNEKEEKTKEGEEGETKEEL